MMKEKVEERLEREIEDILIEQLEGVIRDEEVGRKGHRAYQSGVLLFPPLLH